MKKNITIIRNQPDIICLPVEIIKDLNLSITAIGLAAYIQYQYECLKIHQDADLFFDKIELKLGFGIESFAYNELCDAGVINDFLKEGIEL
jgi:hypothetical protein